MRTKHVNTLATQDEASQAFTNRLHAEGIAPNAEKIARIFEQARVAVLVFDLDPKLREAATSVGWNGKDQVFTLRPDAQERLAISSEKSGDKKTAKWLRRGTEGRLLVMAQLRPLLINYTRDGFELEPDSDDPASWMR